MARCDECKLSRVGGNGSCPLTAEHEEERRYRGDHDCAVFRPREVIAKARKVRKNLAERDWRLAQEELF